MTSQQKARELLTYLQNTIAGEPAFGHTFEVVAIDRSGLGLVLSLNDGTSAAVHVAGQAFLSAKEVAERIGVKPGTLSRYSMPEPDVTVGTVRGWTADTIDRWNSTRPGRGRRKAEA